MAFELYDLENDPLAHHNLAGDRALADVEADLKFRLLTWRRETFDPLLDDEYFERLRAHTEAHGEAHKQAAEADRSKGTQPPYYRLNMAPFQEDWPPPWTR